MGDDNKIAVLAGASGLVGAHLLAALLDSPEFSRVYVVTRRPLGREHPRLANRIVQFDRLEPQLKGLACTTAFCCLGSSLRAAGSEHAWRAAEVDRVLAFARAARAGGAQRFVHLSCSSAVSARDVAGQLKRDCEQGLEALGFGSLDILQPGPLLGLRRDIHPAQLLRAFAASLAAPALVGAREIHRAVPARVVAAAMLGAARSGRRGVYRYTYSGIRALTRVPAPSRAQAAPSSPRDRVT